MTFKLPNVDQLRSVGADIGMDITETYAQSVIDFIAPFAEGYRTVVALADDLPPVKYPRTSGYRPEGDENKYGAWAVKINIKGASKGRLSGKKVAVKDTYALAGVPLTNGASVLEGYVPEFDATIVTRLLDAGAEIVGKSVCEYFSFSGGAATSVTGPVHNPRAWGHTPGGSSTGSGALVAAGRSRHGNRWRPGRLDPNTRFAIRCRRDQTHVRSWFLTRVSWEWTRLLITPDR